LPMFKRNNALYHSRPRLKGGQWGRLYWFYFRGKAILFSLFDPKSQVEGWRLTRTLKRILPYYHRENVVDLIERFKSEKDSRGREKYNVYPMTLSEIRAAANGRFLSRQELESRRVTFEKWSGEAQLFSLASGFESLMLLILFSLAASVVLGMIEKPFLTPRVIGKGIISNEDYDPKKPTILFVSDVQGLVTGDSISFALGPFGDQASLFQRLKKFGQSKDIFLQIILLNAGTKSLKHIVNSWEDFWGIGDSITIIDKEHFTDYQPNVVSIVSYNSVHPFLQEYFPGIPNYVVGEYERPPFPTWEFLLSNNRGSYVETKFRGPWIIPHEFEEMAVDLEIELKQYPLMEVKKGFLWKTGYWNQGFISRTWGVSHIFSKHVLMKYLFFLIIKFLTKELVTSC